MSAECSHVGIKSKSKRETSLFLIKDFKTKCVMLISQVVTIGTTTIKMLQ